MACREKNETNTGSATCLLACIQVSWKCISLKCITSYAEHFVSQTSVSDKLICSCTLVIIRLFAGYVYHVKQIICPSSDKNPCYLFRETCIWIASVNTLVGKAVSLKCVVLSWSLLGAVCAREPGQSPRVQEQLLEAMLPAACVFSVLWSFMLLSEWSFSVIGPAAWRKEMCSTMFCL